MNAQHASYERLLAELEHNRCDGGCTPSAPPCVEGLEHVWLGVGGCDQNPGVRSAGGTTLVFTAGCRWCGTRRQAVLYGRQRNPGVCDTIEWTEGVYPVDEAALAAELRRARRNRRARQRRAAKRAVRS